MANTHMERGGRPVKKINTSDIMPLMMTCHPIAMYFSCDFLSRKFQSAWSEADRKSKTMAKMGMSENVPQNAATSVLGGGDAATIVLLIKLLHLGFGHPFHNWVIGLFIEMFPAVEIKHVTGLGGLGFKIEKIMFVRLHDVRDAVRDDDAVLGELLDLFRVVGDQLNGPDF